MQGKRIMQELPFEDSLNFFKNLIFFSLWNLIFSEIFLLLLFHGRSNLLMLPVGICLVVRRASCLDPKPREFFICLYALAHSF